jgi:replicative DNA helicase
MSKKWKSHAKHYEEALVYMRKRQQGKISSFKTPWPKINDAAIGGFEWHSITIIGARPGGGKTLMKDQMIREGFKLNKGQGIRVLEFQLEMVGKNSKLREFSAISKKTYKYLCSAETEGVVIDDTIIDLCVKHAQKAAQYPVDIVDTPPTADEFKKIVHEYMQTHASKSKVKDKDGVERIIYTYKKTVVTLDHSVLLKKMRGQSTMDMLNGLGEACTELKKLYPVAFVILSQLNRDITNPVRAENGKYGNYILESDIFGADALLQHADLVIGIDRPALRHISEYGPDRYKIEDDSVLVAHILKTRTGDTRMSFLRAVFQHMKVEEMPTPGVAEVKKKK